MKSHYRPPPGKWSVAPAAIAAVILIVGGAYTFFDKAAIIALPPVTSPDMTRSFSKSETPYLPGPIPKTVNVPPPRSSDDIPTRRLGPGIYRCEDANGAVTYADAACGDGKLVDTKPTSGGFADNWSISVKHR